MRAVVASAGRSASAAFAVLACVLAAVAGATPAQAAPERALLVSHDGVSFEPVTEARIFSDLAAVVPGDEVRESIWVQNAAAEGGTLTIGVIGARTDDPRLAAATTVTVTGVGVSATTTIAEAVAAGGTAELSPGEPLAAGETVRIDAELAVAPALGTGPEQPGNAGARGMMSFELVATLTQSEGTRPRPNDVPAGEGSPDDPPRRDLAVTGAGRISGPAWLGLAAAAVGGMLAALSGRRRERSHA